MASGELTSKQQTSEAIRQAETILITTAQRPTVDQVAAVVSMAMILRKFGKRATAVISDNLPAAVKFLDTSIVERSLKGQRDFIIKVDVGKTEVESLRYEVEGNKLNIFLTPFAGGFEPRDVTFGQGEMNLDYDLVMVVGVASRFRIDRIYNEHPSLFAAVPVVNIDFRRSNEGFGAINLIDPSVSSLCEIVLALSESLQAGMVDADIATVMLTGLMAATERFTAPHTSAKSLTIAAQMMAAGGDQQKVVRGLYGGGEPRGGEPRGGESRGNERGEARPERRQEKREARPAVVSGEVAPSEAAPSETLPGEVVKDEPAGGLPAVETVAVAQVITATKEMPPTEEPSVVSPVERETFVPVAEEVVPTFEPVALADQLPPDQLPPTMQPEVFAGVMPETVLPPVPTSTPTLTSTPATEPTAVADFTAAAEILRRHHANIVEPNAGTK